VIVKAGEVLFIPAGTIHSARILGSGRGRELATYIVEKAKPLFTVAKGAPGEVTQSPGQQ
jgi:quercetin dioxygenase-like cupin family protein